MTADLSIRCGDPPDDVGPITAIEIGFGIPVYLTQEQYHSVQRLINEIVDMPCNQPRDGVHWPAGCGGRPSFSKADSAFLGKPVDPNAPDVGEPSFDMSIFYIECCARGFVSEKERQRKMKQREGIPL